MLRRNWLGSRWIQHSSRTGAQVVVKTANVVKSCCCCFAENYAKLRAAHAVQLFSIQMTVNGSTGGAERVEIIVFVY